MSKNLLKAGQRSPLIVFKPTGESLYSVIEGETRRRPFNMNATAGKIDADAEIRCWVMPEDTTLERLLVVAAAARSDEHPSALQSLMRISYAVSCWKTKIH